MRPHRRQPIELLHPWDSPGKNTGVGYHFLLQCMKVKSESEVAQSCPTLRDPMGCSLPGSSVHGSFQARVLEWDAIAFSCLYKMWLCEWTCISLFGHSGFTPKHVTILLVSVFIYKSLLVSSKIDFVFLFLILLLFLGWLKKGNESRKVFTPLSLYWKSLRFLFFFYHTMCLVGSQLPNQGLNPCLCW